VEKRGGPEPTERICRCMCVSVLVVVSSCLVCCVRACWFAVGQMGGAQPSVLLHLEGSLARLRKGTARRTNGNREGQQSGALRGVCVHASFDARVSVGHVAPAFLPPLPLPPLLLLATGRAALPSLRI
jgi:hypothetical protein